jgi:hypothetical protein
MRQLTPELSSRLFGLISLVFKNLLHLTFILTTKNQILCQKIIRI